MNPPLDSPAAPNVDRYRANLQAEVDSAALYRGLADAEGNDALAELYRRLAAVEEHQSRTASALHCASPPSDPPGGRGRRGICIGLAERRAERVI